MMVRKEEKKIALPGAQRLRSMHRHAEFCKYRKVTGRCSEKGDRP